MKNTAGLAPKGVLLQIMAHLHEAYTLPEPGCGENGGHRIEDKGRQRMQAAEACGFSNRAHFTGCTDGLWNTCRRWRQKA